MPAPRKTPERVRNLKRAESGRRVLIVDDNTDAAQSLRDALALGGHEVHVAYDPHDGIAKARSKPPEIILCDIGLPGMDGLELARVFRSDEILKGVFLVAISGYTTARDVERAVAAGFDTHLAKPATIEQVMRIVQAAPPFASDPSKLPQ
jgi:CheY-like chemotaxis protein